MQGPLFRALNGPEAGLTSVGDGLFGGGSADYGTGGASATGGVNLGLGSGAAGGTQACITRTWCY